MANIQNAIEEGEERRKKWKKKATSKAKRKRLSGGWETDEEAEVDGESLEPEEDEDIE